MIGKTVGKYRIIERLGRGGMGTVYKAIDETLDREVAIKVLNADLADTDILRRFRAEAVTLARLNHPGIATLYELYRDEDDLLMVMEFVRGETVHELSERLGALAAPQGAHLAMQVLDALAHAHRAGVVHRDLKPANLMVTEMGIVKVMDFGIARVLGTEHFTQGGYMMGTPAYMAPEQVLGGEIDGRADLYAVGVVLYRLLSAQLPFSADTAIAMVQKQVNEPPTPITQFQPDLPSWCEQVVTHALAKSPADRFQTADEFRTALLSAVQPQTLGEMPTMATPTPLGLRIGDKTLTQPSASATPEGYSQRASAAAVATPLATSVPGAVPPPAPPPISPVAVPVVRAAEGATTTLVLGRKQLFGFGAIGLVLIVGVAAFGLYALRRSTFPQQLQIGAQPSEETKPPTDPSGAKPATDAESGTADRPAGAAPPGAPVAPTPPTAPPAPQPGTDAGAAGAKAAGRVGAPAPGAPGTVPPATAGARGAKGSLPAPPGTEPSPASGTVPASASAPDTPEPPVTAASTSSAPPVTFDDVRVLVKSGDRTRELTGVLSLGNGQLAVLDKAGGTSLVSLPYSSLTGAAYSRSKQPRWKDADGRDVEAKVDIGKLGFLRSDRNWVILFSHGEPTFLRIEDASLRTVLPAIESHAGLKVRR
jgi:eukaryotic-like serine/threonine-protein kinase